MSDEEDEEKEICVVCWICGNILCIGYIDGDVWIWSIFLVIIDDFGISCFFILGEFFWKLDILFGKLIWMFIFVMVWFGDLRVSKSGGWLYLVGGWEVGFLEVFIVSFLNFYFINEIVYVLFMDVCWGVYGCDMKFFD